LAEEYAKKISFVGVSNNDTVEDGQDYAESFEVPYPLAHAPEVWGLYDVPYQPVTIVLDARGREVARFDGPITEEQLRGAIEQALS
jgi:hypothetical protein